MDSSRHLHRRQVGLVASNSRWALRQPAVGRPPRRWVIGLSVARWHSWHCTLAHKQPLDGEVPWWCLALDTLILILPTCAGVCISLPSTRAAPAMV